MRPWISTVFLFAFAVALSAQENVFPFTANPVLIKEWQKKSESNSVLRSVSLADTIQNLPFRDDFSDYTGYPDTSLWIDDNVFVNRDLPVAPVTLGVATFDGVSRTGLPYDTVLTSFGTSRKCDSLTSKYIDLQYTAADSVYFSFFYQAMGR